MYYLKHKPKHIEFSNEGSFYENIRENVDKKIGKVVQDVKAFESENPLAFYGISGGLVGAGLGSMSNVLLNRNKKKSNFRKMVEGGLLGGIAGAGLGTLGKYAFDKIPSNYFKGSLSKDDKAGADLGTLEIPSDPFRDSLPKAKQTEYDAQIALDRDPEQVKKFFEETGTFPPTFRVKQ